MRTMQKCGGCGAVFLVVKAVAEPKEEADGGKVVVTVRCDADKARYCPHCGMEL